MPLPAQDGCYDTFFCFMPCWHRTAGHADKVHSWLECYEGFSLVAPTLITEMLVNCSFTKYGSPLRHLWSTLALRISTPSGLTLSAVAPSTCKMNLSLMCSAAMFRDSSWVRGGGAASKVSPLHRQNSSKAGLKQRECQELKGLQDSKQSNAIRDPWIHSSQKIEKAGICMSELGSVWCSVWHSAKVNLTRKVTVLQPT